MIDYYFSRHSTLHSRSSSHLPAVEVEEGRLASAFNRRCCLRSYSVLHYVHPEAWPDIHHLAKVSSVIDLFACQYLCRIWIQQRDLRLIRQRLLHQYIRKDSHASDRLHLRHSRWLPGFPCAQKAVSSVPLFTQIIIKSAGPWTSLTFALWWFKLFLIIDPPADLWFLHVCEVLCGQWRR